MVIYLPVETTFPPGLIIRGIHGSSSTLEKYSFQLRPLDPPNLSDPYLVAASFSYQRKKGEIRFWPGFDTYRTDDSDHTSFAYIHRTILRAESRRMGIPPNSLIDIVDTKSNTLFGYREAGDEENRILEFITRHILNEIHSIGLAGVVYLSNDSPQVRRVYRCDVVNHPTRQSSFVNNPQSTG